MPFDFEGIPVRVITADGEPWWIAADIARVLGYRDADRVLRLLDDDMRGTHYVGTPGGPQQMAVITRGALFRLILRSRKPAAKRFERLVVDVILPSIAATGSYATPAAKPSTEVDLMDPAVFHKVLGRALEQRDTARAELEAAEAKVADLTPAAEAWRTMNLRDRDLIPSRAVKLLQTAGCRVKTREIHAWLQDQKWTFRRGTGPVEPYATVIEKGWMKLYVDNGYHPTERGPEPNGPQACFTLLGLERARDLLITQRGSTFVDPAQTRLQLVASD